MSENEAVEIGVNPAERLRNSRNALGVVNDPHPRLDELRATGDVVEGSLAGLFGVPDPVFPPDMFPGARWFTALGLDAVETIFRSHETFSNRVYAPATKLWGANLLAMDEPEHRRYRSLAQPAFAAKAMRDWEVRWLGPMLDRLIDGFAGAERADLYMEYCARFPAHTIASAFGIPAGEVEWFHDLVLRSTGIVPPDEQAAATEKVADHLTAILDRRRAEPGDDVISLLAHSELKDEDGTSHRLTDEKVLGFAYLMLVAGSGTTYRSMGMMLLALLRRPDILRRAADDRSLIPKVVEEALRWQPPQFSFPRIAVRDAEVAGVAVPAGSLVDVVVGAANRDPRYFEDPHVFDPFRATFPHVAFGKGPHFCIGNQLARMELRVALERLLDRVPEMRLDPDAAEPYITGLQFRMPTAVPVLL